MAKKNESGGLIVLAIVFFLIVLFAVLYFLTREESAKQRRDSYKDRAEELKRQITEKENLLSFLVIEMDRAKQFEKFLIEQAESVCRFAKLIVYSAILGSALISYFLFECAFWESLLTTVAILGLIYSAFTVYFLNKIGDLNTALKMLHDYIVVRIYKKYGFEPEYLKTLETKVNNVREELSALKNSHNLLLEKEI